MVEIGMPKVSESLLQKLENELKPRNLSSVIQLPLHYFVRSWMICNSSASVHILCNRIKFLRSLYAAIIFFIILIGALKNTCIYFRFCSCSCPYICFFIPWFLHSCCGMLNSYLFMCFVTLKWVAGDTSGIHRSSSRLTFDLPTSSLYYYY